MKDVCLTLGGLIWEKKLGEKSADAIVPEPNLCKMTDCVIGSDKERVVGKGRT